MQANNDKAKKKVGSLLKKKDDIASGDLETTFYRHEVS